MSGVKHTPGPWHWLVSANSDGSPDAHQIGEPALVARNGQMICWFGDSAPYDNSSGICPDEANARLIAAAPDLLEALEEFSREYDGFEDGNGDPCPVLAKARAAVARARGES